MKETIKKYIPSFIAKWYLQYKTNQEHRRAAIINKWGVEVRMKDDIYSPLPVLEELKKNEKRWNKPSSFSNINFNLEEMKTLLANIINKHFKGLDDFYKMKDLEEFGLGFNQIDAMLLYCILSHYKPSKYYEVGCGMSTFITHYARTRNNFNCEIKTVEPYPFDRLYELPNITIIKEFGQNIPLNHFDSLSENDILFIDTTHIVKIDSEVNYLILEILPRLQKGVIIHFHDIPFPFNFPYPASYWITGRAIPKLNHWQMPQYWQEPVLLQAFLMYNPNFEILMSMPMLRHFDEQFLYDTIPNYQSATQHPNTFSSLWLRKIK
jgi:hypothetical protein